MERDGGRFGSEVVVKENPASWVSKYGSMIIQVYGVGAVDGFNECGLGMHMLTSGLPISGREILASRERKV
jgi:penicillin V acylase-like amidase (Ntn superfamily)